MEKVTLCAWLLSIFQTKNGGPCGLRGDQGPPCKVQQLSCPGNFDARHGEAGGLFFLLPSPAAAAPMFLRNPYCRVWPHQGLWDRVMSHLTKLHSDGVLS